MIPRLVAVLLLATVACAVRVLNSDQEDFLLDRRNLRRRLQEEGPADNPEAHRITSLPLADPVLPFDLFAGHLKASQDGDKKFFYWLVAPEDIVARASPNTPLLLWLNGGPGCSSSDGFFLENGPLMFEQQEDKQYKLVANPNSWHLAPAWVLYVDQPVGTGLSITHSGNYPKNDKDVNVDFQFFMEEFLLFFGDFFLSVDHKEAKNPIFFSGESHAGHYIPSMMDFILSNADKARVKMTLGGAAIGNGWIDPFNQYAASDLAYGMGLINLSQKAHLDEQEKDCQKLLKSGVFNSMVCFSLLDTVVDQSHGANAPTHVSMYDARKVEYKSMPRVFPAGHGLVQSYLAGDSLGVVHTDVLQAIHAIETFEVDQKYRECADPPYEALKHQDGMGVVPQLTSLLENNVRVMFYNGMHDLVCNHIGTEKALMKLPWSQIEQWSLAPGFTWSIGKGTSPAAYVHEYQNLVYLKIPNAGHMVPQDQPEVALRMMQTFLHGESFKQYQQYLDRSILVEKAC